MESWSNPKRTFIMYYPVFLPRVTCYRMRKNVDKFYKINDYYE